MAKAKVSRSALIREALGTEGLATATAKEIAEYVKKTHGVAVTDALIYNVKNAKKTKKGKPGRKPKPKAKASSNGVLVSHAAPKAASHGLMLADIATVKGLLNRLGTADLKELIDVLA